MDLEQIRQALRDGTYATQPKPIEAKPLPIGVKPEHTNIARPDPDESEAVPRLIADRVGDHGVLLKRRTILRFRKGTSNKTYHVYILQHPDDGTCSVYAEWGKAKQEPRTRQHQVKAHRVHSVDADTTARKLTNEKMKKGYTVAAVAE